MGLSNGAVRAFGGAGGNSDGYGAAPVKPFEAVFIQFLEGEERPGDAHIAMADTGGAQVARLGRRVRVLIADTHPVIRRAVRSTLLVHPEIEVCGEATTGVEAIEEAKKLKPDVVVMNITLPVLNGFETAREIKAVLPEAAIVILSQHADREFVEEARKIGIRAYVAKTRAAEALVKAVQAAAIGEDFVLIE